MRFAICLLHRDMCAAVGAGDLTWIGRGDFDAAGAFDVDGHGVSFLPGGWGSTLPRGAAGLGWGARSHLVASQGRSHCASECQ